MLAIKEKKKEGKGYFLRIGLLMMNLFFIMLIVQGICCLQDADKNGAFQMENRIGEQYIICLTEQMQGVLEIIILAFCI